MTKISQFNYKGQDIEILMNNGKISYIFEIKGKRFGNAVKVDGRKKLDLVNAVFALLLNYLETRESAEKI